MLGTVDQFGSDTLKTVGTVVSEITQNLQALQGNLTNTLSLLNNLQLPNTLGTAQGLVQDNALSLPVSSVLKVLPVVSIVGLVDDALAGLIA